MLLTQQWIPFVIWMNFLPMIFFLFKPDLGLTAGEIQPWKRLHGWPPLLLEKGCFKGCADSAALWLLTICEQLLQGSCPVFNGLQRLLCVVAKVMGPYSRVSGILNKITTESHTLLHLDFLCFCASNTTSLFIEPTSYVSGAGSTQTQISLIFEYGDVISENECDELFWHGEAPSFSVVVVCLRARLAWLALS